MLVSAADVEIARLTDLPEWASLLDRLVQDLYLPSFPNDDEREDPSLWLSRLSTRSPAPPQPVTHIFVAGQSLRRPGRGSGSGSADDGARRLDGFLVVEQYRESGCLLATYLAVAPPARGARVASRLVEHAAQALAPVSSGAAPPVLFAEVTDPHEPKAGGDGDFDAFERARLLSRMGWRHVPIDYVQPALGAGRSRVRHLMLWARPLDERAPASVPATTLRAFLAEFYRALGVEQPERDPDWQSAVRQAGLASLPLETVGVGTPRLSFDTYGVAFHYVVSGVSGAVSQPIRSSAAFRSFERDLLAHAFRDAPPFWSAVVPQPEHRRRLDLILPNVMTYEAEGRRKRLLVDPGDGSAGAERRRSVRLFASVTVFPKPRDITDEGTRTGFDDAVAVLHLVLTPDAGADHHAARPFRASLSEWDLVTLIKLWEGGEAVEGASGVALADCVRFEDGRGQASTLAGLAAEVFDDALVIEDPGVTVKLPPGEARAWALRAPRVGSVQVLTGAHCGGVDWKSLYGRLVDRYGNQQAPATAPLDAEGCAVAGMLQGLLDFPYIDPVELSDAFQRGVDAAHRSVRLTESLMLGVHKGTLLCIMDDCRVYRSIGAEIGISPYLILPHSALLCNGHLLELARDAARRARSAPGRAEAEMRDALEGRFLPNAFHYPLERYLFDAGMTSRRLLDLKESLQSRLIELIGQRRDARERREHRFEWRLTVIGVAFAMLQLLSLFPLLELTFDPDFISRMVNDLGLRNVAWLGIARLLGPFALVALAPVIVLIGLWYVERRHRDH